MKQIKDILKHNIFNYFSERVYKWQIKQF